MGRRPGEQLRLATRTRYLLSIFLAPLLTGVVLAQAQPPSSTLKQPAAPDELSIRAAAAAATARDSGDSAAVALANELVIATALREMAGIRVVESAYSQAIELYRSSLNFEDADSGRVGLALANVQAGHFDEAIHLAAPIAAAHPDDLRADRALASAYVQKNEYAEAVAPFTRIAEAQPSVDNLYPLAVCLLQTRKPEDKPRAAAVFERMRQTAGDSGSLHVLIGRAYRDAEDMQTAVAEFRRAIALDPRTPHAHYFLGLAQLFLNDWKPTPEAEAEFRKEAESFPRDYLANYMLGFLTSGERNYAESNQYLLAASVIDPTAPEPFLYLGLNAYSQEDMKRAEEMLRKAVVLTGADEARSNYQIRRAYVDLGRILATSGRGEESDVFIAKARNLQNKTMVQSQQNIASIALAAGPGSTSAAIMPLTREQEEQAAPLLHDSDGVFAKVDPAAISQSKLTAEQRTAADAREKALRAVLGLAFNDLATSEARRGEYPRALSYYQQAERWDETLPGLQKNLGQCAFRARDYAAAARALEAAVAQSPDVPALRAMLGISYFAINQYAEAAKTFAPLGSLGMTDGESGYAWAASLAHTGDMKRASEVLTAFEAEPRSNDTLLLIGQLWTQIGDYPRATATLERALAADPSLLKAHFSLGLADIHWQHWPDAAKQFQAELALAPGDPDAAYHLGFVYLQQSKTEEAVALFRQVVAAHPAYANAQYELGKVLLDRNQVPDAVGYLEAAARLSPQTDYMHYQLQAAYRKEDRLADADRELEVYKQLKTKSRERAADAAKFNP